MGGNSRTGPGVAQPLTGARPANKRRRAVEASLNRLQTGYIDLYWIHIWDALSRSKRSCGGSTTSSARAKCSQETAAQFLPVGTVVRLTRITSARPASFRAASL